MAIARPGEPQALALAAIFASGSAAQSLDVVEHWFQSRSRVAPFVSARAVAFVIASLAKIACLATHAPLSVLAMAIAGEYLLAAVGLAIADRAAGESFARWRFAAARARALLASSWPLLLSSFAVVVYTRTDQVMLTLMRGDAENGIYAAAQRLSEILYFVPVAVMAAANPALLRAHQEGPAAYESRLGRVFALLAWSASIFALPISLLSSWIVTTLFGAEFRASGPVLALHVWAAPAVFLGVAQATWFVAEGRGRALLARTLAGALLNMALNVALIPRFGASGAAMATLVAQWLASIFLNAMLPSTRGLFRLQGRAILAPLRR
jgi:PST family polysaccharide transporter